MEKEIEKIPEGVVQEPEKAGEGAEKAGKEWEEREKIINEEAVRIRGAILKRLEEGREKEQITGEEFISWGPVASSIDDGEEVIGRLKVLLGVKEKPYAEKESAGEYGKIINRYITDLEKVIYQESRYLKKERDQINEFFIVSREDWKRAQKEWRKKIEKKE